jgi:hypothetical protein
MNKKYKSLRNLSQLEEEALQEINKKNVKKSY